MTTSIVTVYAVFGGTEEAERIGAEMVERRLAACVNILPACRSVYRWQGEVERAEEVPALFKTSAARAPALIDAIAVLHGYDLPGAVAWPIADALPAYAQWVIDETRPD